MSAVRLLLVLVMGFVSSAVLTSIEIPMLKQKQFKTDFSGNLIEIFQNIN